MFLLDFNIIRYFYVLDSMFWIVFFVIECYWIIGRFIVFLKQI